MSSLDLSDAGLRQEAELICVTMFDCAPNSLLIDLLVDKLRTLLTTAQQQERERLAYLPWKEILMPIEDGFCCETHAELTAKRIAEIIRARGRG